MVALPSLSLQGGAAAPSGARADAIQQGVRAEMFSDFIVTGGGVFNTRNSSQSGFMAPMATDAQPNKRVENSGFNDPFNLALIALGGVGLWLLLRKK